MAAAPAGATTLVNDPAHPFTAAQMTAMQRWVNVAAQRVLTVPGAIRVSRETCDDGDAWAWACALDHQVNLASADRFVLLHELGHEDQMYDGAGDGTTYPMTSGWTWAKKQRAADLLDLPLAGFWATGPDQRAVAEVSADAYATAALYPHWRRWWQHRVKPSAAQRRAGVLGGVALTATPYDFRAGPKRYAAIQALLRD